MKSLQLSRYKLQAFLTCQRRFQLRYVNELVWPSAPIPTALSEAFARGEQFHRLLEQHWRGLQVDLPLDADQDLQRWWHNFKRTPPQVPAGTRYPELGLSVPIAPIDLAGGHYLFGRFDLLILSPTHAHIFDWKTERRPRPRAALAADWQTRLYLTMVVEGSAALGHTYTPEQVALTYWFANDPHQSVTLPYTTAQHARNWAELKATVERVERRLVAPQAIWPLTDTLDHCRQCEFSNYCGRDVVQAEHGEDMLEMVRAEGQDHLVLEPVPSNTI